MRHLFPRVGIAHLLFSMAHAFCFHFAKSLSWVFARVLNLPNSILIKQEDHLILSGDTKVAWTKALFMSLFLNDFLICKRVPDRIVSAKGMSTVAVCLSRLKACKAFSAVSLQWSSEFTETWYSGSGKTWPDVVKWVGFKAGKKKKIKNKFRFSRSFVRGKIKKRLSPPPL